MELQANLNGGSEHYRIHFKLGYQIKKFQEKQRDSSFKKAKARLVHTLKQQFSIFKQHYTYFHALFHPYVFSKNTNNITRIILAPSHFVCPLFHFKKSQNIVLFLKISH